MSLHDTIIADAKRIATATTEFSETITYYDSDGTARDVKAVVVRTEWRILPEAGDVIEPVFTLYFANDPVVGIDSATMDRSRDVFVFASHVGQEPTRHMISRIVDQDTGWVIVECR